MLSLAGRFLDLAKPRSDALAMTEDWNGLLYEIVYVA
jgi:hypothetical protein